MITGLKGRVMHIEHMRSSGTLSWLRVTGGGWVAVMLDVMVAMLRLKKWKWR